MAGEPGIGKTRLASHHAYAVREAGGTVLYGAVDEALGVPYQPWVEALGHYVEHAPERLLRAFVDDVGSDLVRLIPVLAKRVADLPAPPSSDPETERYRLFDAVSRLLRRAADDNPVLLVLDDLHWADKPTLLLLAHVHRSVPDVSLMLVGTLRDSELTPDHPSTGVLAELRREERIMRMPLSGLDTNEVAQILSNVTGHEPTEEGMTLARMLERDTNGNPLFVAETIRALVEGGHVRVNETGHWSLATGIDELPAPESVREVVGERLARLGPDAVRVLTTAAVIGREFELDLLAAVLDRTADDVLEIAETAIGASLLTESGARIGGLRFTHALIAQALVDGLSALRRAQLHERIAAAIERLHGLGDRVGSVAHHLLASGSDPRRAVDYAQRAGHHALAALAPDEAARWFRSALEVFDSLGRQDDGLRCDLLTDLGIAMRDAGQSGVRDELVSTATAAGQMQDYERMARALLALYTGFTAGGLSQGRDPELIHLLRTVLAGRPERDSTRALLLGSLALELHSDRSLEERSALRDEAVELARREGTARDLTQVLQCYINAMWTLAAHKRRRELLPELLAITPRSGDPNLIAITSWIEFMVALETGDRESLDDAFLRFAAASVDAPLPIIRWYHMMHAVQLSMMDGDLAETERRAREAFTYARANGFTDSGFSIYGIHIANIRLLQGTAGEIADLAGQSVLAAPHYTVFVAFHCLCLAFAGHRQEAERLLDGLIEPMSAVGHNAWSAGVSYCATAARELGHRDIAAALYPLVAPYPDAFIGTVFCTSIVSLDLGLFAATLGDLAAAEAHFAHAVERLEAARTPLLVAQARYEWARAVLELGADSQRDRAEELMTQAIDAYRALDCPARITICQQALADAVGRRQSGESVSS